MNSNKSGFYSLFKWLSSSVLCSINHTRLPNGYCRLYSLLMRYRPINLGYCLIGLQSNLVTIVLDENCCIAY